MRNREHFEGEEMWSGLWSEPEIERLFTSVTKNKNCCTCPHATINSGAQMVGQSSLLRQW